MLGLCNTIYHNILLLLLVHLILKCTNICIYKNIQIPIPLCSVCTRTHRTKENWFMLRTTNIYIYIHMYAAGVRAFVQCDCVWEAKRDWRTFVVVGVRKCECRVYNIYIFFPSFALFSFFFSSRIYKYESITATGHSHIIHSVSMNRTGTHAYTHWIRERERKRVKPCPHPNDSHRHAFIV